jgi:hypothetical protein
MAEYRGRVYQIDVRYIASKSIRCFATLKGKQGSQIQVFTEEPRLQSALELASLLTAKPSTVAVVTYEAVNNEFVVTGVRLEDDHP